MKIRTFLLKTTLVGIGAIVLLFCLFAFPRLITRLHVIYPKIVYERYLFAVCLYVSAGLFYLAEIAAYHILRLIDHDDVFSGTALAAIGHIKHATFGMGVCYALFLPFAFQVAQTEDAPGLILMVTAVALVPFIVSVFAAILEKLLAKATQLKLDNQYTV